MPGPDEPLVLGVDVGSHGVRCVCGSESVDVAYAGPPPPARRPAQQWTDAFVEALSRIPESDRQRVQAVGITGVRGAFVVADAELGPLMPTIPDFDPESVPLARELRTKYGRDLIGRTGCPAFPLSGLPKLMALPDTLGPSARVLPPQDFVASLLTGKARLSAGAALRLGCLDPRIGDIDRELLAELGIAETLFPPVVPIGERLGDNRHPLLPLGIPVVSVAGDGPSARAAVAGKGDGLVSLGTTSVCLLPIAGDRLPDIDLTVELDPMGGRLAEYGSGIGGVAIDWLARLTGVGPGRLEEASRGVDYGPLVVEPTFVSAWGDAPGARLANILPDTTVPAIAAALFDAIGRDALASIGMLAAVAGMPPRIYLTGGCARSARVVDLLRTNLACDVIPRGDRELAAAGAAGTARHYALGR